jgi:hypothetical protein
MGSIKENETMSSDRGWYLLAAGVLALGLGNLLTTSDGLWARDLVVQSAATFEQSLSKAETYVAMAEMLLGAGGDHSWARAVHTRLSRQAEMARHRAEVAQAQMERAHGLAIGAGRQQIVHCASMNRVGAPQVLISRAGNF